MVVCAVYWINNNAPFKRSHGNKEDTKSEHKTCPEGRFYHKSRPLGLAKALKGLPSSPEVHILLSPFQLSVDLVLPLKHYQAVKSDEPINLPKYPSPS